MKKCFFLVVIFFCYSVLADVNEFKTEDGHFKISYNSNDWTPFVNYLGLPFVFIGPKYDGHRVTMTVIPTTVDYKHEPGKMLQSLESYKEGRIEFIRSMNGVVERFLPYKIFKLKTVSIGHHYGYQSKINNQLFEEHDFLLECKTGQLYNSKILSKGPKRSEAAADAIKILKSFVCKK